MHPLLILRPQPGAAASAALAAAMGLNIVVHPLFEARPLDWAPPDSAQFDALMLTSANAARLGGANLALYGHLPLFCVGKATADAASAAGLGEPCVGEGNAEELMALIAAAGHQRVLHLAGRDRTSAKAIGDVAIVSVYASERLPAPQLPLSAVALLHSRRAAVRFGAIVRTRSAYAIVAISPAVAAAAGIGWRAVAIAAAPCDAAMLALAASLCEMPDW